MTRARVHAACNDVRTFKTRNLDSLMLEIIYTFSRSNTFYIVVLYGQVEPSFCTLMETVSFCLNTRNWTDSVTYSIQSYHNGAPNRSWYSLHYPIKAERNSGYVRSRTYTSFLRHGIIDESAGNNMVQAE